MFAFLVAKYAALGLTSLRAVLLAALLGPASFGVLGTLILAQQNLSYLALGVREGLTVELAKAPGDTKWHRIICSSALFWAWCVGTFILCSSIILVLIFRVGDLNWVWVGIISYLSVTNEVLININRDRNKILKVALVDLMFNAIPLGAALIFMHRVTVTVMLMAMAGGLLLSVLLYASAAREYRWNYVSRRTLRVLLTTGIQLSLVSLTTTALASIFVFVGSAMKLGKSVGLLVFANSICAIVLFGLNMVAWAATSTMMKRIHADIGSPGAADIRGDRLRAFFRVGVAGSLVAILVLRLFFRFALHAYAGCEVFAVYLCLLQSYVLLLYKELNYLAVRSRSLWIAAGYGCVLLVVLATAVAVPKIEITSLMQIALASMGVLSLGCVHYCRRLGFVDRNFRMQAIILCFPLAFGTCFAALGAGGAVPFGALVLIALLKMHGRELGTFKIQSAAA